MEPKPKAIIIHYYIHVESNYKQSFCEWKHVAFIFSTWTKMEMKLNLSVSLCLSYNREIFLSSLSPMCVTLLAFSLFVYALYSAILHGCNSIYPYTTDFQDYYYYWGLWNNCSRSVWNVSQRQFRYSKELRERSGIMRNNLRGKVITLHPC